MIRGKFLGTAALNRRLKRLPGKVQSNLREEFAEGARQLTRHMKARVPKDSGDLERTIEWRFGTSRAKYAQGSTNTSGMFAITVTAGGQVNGVDVRYAHIVEFGSAPREQGGRFKGMGVMHPGTPAQPFFFPTYRQLRRRLRNRRRRAFRKAIEASAS